MHADALNIFNRNRRAVRYAQKQCKISIKRAAKSERDKFSNVSKHVLPMSVDTNNVAISYW